MGLVDEQRRAVQLVNDLRDEGLVASQGDVLLLGDLIKSLVDCFVGNRPHLVVSTILNRVFDPNSGRIKPQRLSLHFGSNNELGRSYKNPWKPTSFQVSDVMHTA